MTGIGMRGILCRHSAIRECIQQNWCDNINYLVFLTFETERKLEPGKSNNNLISQKDPM